MPMIRKTLLLVLPLLFLFRPASATDYLPRHGVGLRLGNDIGLDYKMFFGNGDALSLGAGIVDPFIKDGPAYVLFMPQYHFTFEVGEMDNLYFYVGPGISAGVQFGSEFVALRQNRTFYFSVDAAIGLEYYIPGIPLAVSFNWSPKVQLCGHQEPIYKYDSNGNQLSPTDIAGTTNKVFPLFADIFLGIRYLF